MNGQQLRERGANPRRVGALVHEGLEHAGNDWGHSRTEIAEQAFLPAPVCCYA